MVPVQVNEFQEGTSGIFDDITFLYLHGRQDQLIVNIMSAEKLPGRHLARPNKKIIPWMSEDFGKW